MEIQAAVVAHNQTIPEITGVTLDSLRPDELLVRMVATGICATDLKVLSNPVYRPVILGHEGAGVVEEVGTDVENVSPGDHVILTFDSCGTCGSCKDGHPAYCETFRARNFSGRRLDQTAGACLHDGHPVMARFFGQSSFATHAIATVRNVVVVPNDVDLATLAPLGCGVQTGAGAILNVLRPGPDDKMLVIGAGAVGLSALLACRSRGVSCLVVDPDRTRRALALELGAISALDASEGTTPEIINQSLGGAPTHALVTAPVASAFDLAVAALASRGFLGFVAAPPQGTWKPDWLPIMTKGIHIQGIIEGDADPQRLIPDLIALWRRGHFPFDRLIRFYPFAAIADALQDTATGTSIKSVLRF